MRALIWIIILILVGWGIWYFVRDDGVVTSAVPTSQVDASTDYDVDLSEFQSKG